MDLYDFERSERKMGCHPTTDKLLLRCGAHPWCLESSNDLAFAKGCSEAD